MYAGYDNEEGMQEGEKRYEIRVHGRVQGVGFRYAASKQARYLGLKGWVENQIETKGAQSLILPAKGLQAAYG